MSTAPTRVRPPSKRSWLSLALAGACGVLLGALLATALGGATRTTRTETRRVTVPSPPLAGGTVITKTLVPTLVGEPLDVARQRAERMRFALKIDSGGGVFGVLREGNWEVVAQRPVAGELLEQGSTVRVDIVRR